MSSARVARRIAAGAAYGGGSIGLLGAAAVGVVLAEVQLAKRQVGGGIAPVPPSSDGRYGVAFTGPAEPLLLGLLGDSTAAGQGVRRAGQTPGALLASGLAAVSERPVDLRNVAQPGARSDDLERQVSVLLADASRTPDVCVIMIGANDVTHRMPATHSVRCLTTAVRRLRTTGAEVVVGTCPDLGTIEPVYQPLRWLARRASRQLAAAQTIGSVEQGGRTVSLGDLLGPEFEANPRELFGPDNYHPSAEGYATAAMALLPTLCAVLGLWPESDRLDGSRREDMLPVPRRRPRRPGRPVRRSRARGRPGPCSSTAGGGVCLRQRSRSLSRSRSPWLGPVPIRTGSIRTGSTPTGSTPTANTPTCTRTGTHARAGTRARIPRPGTPEHPHALDPVHRPHPFD